MTTPQLVLSIIYFIVALGLIAVVMLQSGKSAGLSGVFGGNSDTFLSKNKAKSADARLAKMILMHIPLRIQFCPPASFRKVFLCL